MKSRPTQDDIVAYFLVQLTTGCDSLTCDNENCKSSRKFKEPNSSYEDYAKLLAGQYQKNPRSLCSNLSPLIKDPKLIEYLVKGAPFFNSVCHQIPLQNIEDFVQILEKKEAFCHILLATDGILSPNNLNFDGPTIQDFFNGIVTRGTELRKYKDKLIRVVQGIINMSSTLTKLRGIILAFLFPYIFEEDNLIISLLSVITCFTRTELYIFHSTLVKTPELIACMVHSLHIFIDHYIQSNPNLHPHSHDYHVIAAVDQILFNANLETPKPLPSDKFSNVEFCKNLDPRCEAELVNVTELSYLSFPAILTTVFMKDTLVQERILNNVIKGAQGTFNISVDRKNIISDTLQAILSATSDLFELPLKVTFKNEKGQDEGGVSREFFKLVTEAIFRPEFQMFGVVNDSMYWFEPSKSVTSFQLENYRGVGIIVGLALSSSNTINVTFPNLLYKKLLGRKITIDDYAEINKDVADGLKYYMENPDQLDEVYFEADIKQGWTVPLLDGGTETPVTPDRVDEYVNLYVDMMANKIIGKQFQAFSEGFWMGATTKTARALNYDELSQLVSGGQVYDWENLRAAAKLEGYTSTSPSLVMFWEVFDELKQEDKVRLLYFITASSVCPVGGLASYKITIVHSSDTNKLPHASTCTLHFTLPDYRNKEKMRQSIRVCVENNQGFGSV